MYTVNLSRSEMTLAAMIGVLRHVSGIVENRKRNPALPEEKDNWTTHIEGVAGEMAFAKAKNLYWDASVDTFKSRGDVAGYEVRTTPNPNGGLIVRPPDRDDRIYVLVRGKVPHFRVIGWMRGQDAKDGRFFCEGYDDKPDMYLVPGDDLQKLEDLPQPEGI